MSKWTPGPWKLVEQRGRGGAPSKWRIEARGAAKMGDPEYRPPFSFLMMNDDDARLITAAPEMAELIQKMLDRAGQLDPFTEQEARALLAKVEGK